MAGELKAEMSIDFVNRLARDIHEVLPSFEGTPFVNMVFNAEWNSLELKARIQRVAQCLGGCFEVEYPQALEALHAVAPNHTGLPALVFPEFVEQFGLEHWIESMDSLAFFTPYSSSELAVRPFIRQDQERMMRQMLLWTKSGDHHIRRLASEGCRPRLPWASPLRRFIHDPDPVLPILEALKDDSEDYVRRSVANNLNDISKDHPELALQLGADWIGESKRTRWVVKHGLRTMLKKGNTEALLLFGYGSPDSVTVENLHVDGNEVAIGASTDIRFDVVVKKKPIKLRVEYAVGYLKANGKHSQKVFQVGKYEFTPGVHAMKRRQSFRQMTTRKHYPGIHYVVAIVNGQEMMRTDFSVVSS